MIVAFDVKYYETYAKSVAVCFERWDAPSVLDVTEQDVHEVADYVPGQFYKRELPCILAILQKMDLKKIECIVVDGYVQLDDAGKLGLGGYLYESIKGAVPVIGVAKSSFFQNKRYVRALLRGKSQKPLYISAVGIDLVLAYQAIESMHGDYRMPTLLQLLDGRTKS